MENDWPLPDHDANEQPEDLPPPPVPPPDVWEFYRRHGRWPNPEEA